MYIEDMLPKVLNFEFREVGIAGKWGVFEHVKKEDCIISVGCVFVGTAVECRTYVAQRNSKAELRAIERVLNPRAPLVELLS
jgi:hypothetical protein